MSEPASHSPAPSVPRSQTAPEDKVPVIQKVAYGLGTTLDMWGNWLYPGLIWIVFNIALGVPPWLVSTALMLNRLFDAVSDPLFGWLSDNTRTRWGRRRPYILVGSIAAGICLPCLVWVSPGWGSTTLFGTVIPNYFWYMVVSSAIYITIVSCFNVPWQSLGAELTPDVHERTSVFTYKTALQKLPEIGLFAGAAFSTSTVWAGATRENAGERFLLMFERAGTWFADVFGALFSFEFGRLPALLGNAFGWATPTEGEVNQILGAQVYTMLLGAIMVLVGIFVFATVKERYYHSVTERKQEKVRIRETIWEVLKCRPFRANLAMAFAYAMGTAMVGTLGYYATVYYVCKGNVSEGSVWNFWMGASNSVLGLVGVAAFALIAHRLGKRGAMACVQVAAIAVFIATWWLYTPDIVWLQIFASGLIAFTGAGFWMLYGSIGADIIDYDELEYGKRREGAFTACGSWIMKVGQAVGIGASGYVLSATGFDSALGANQSPEAIWNIRFYLAAIPVVGLSIALIMLARFTLTQQRSLEIRAALEARRGKV
ncbi:MAG: MFS transporter [Opitutaceae bacterium]|nr:MFS transporter [Opitutaceae bacterium]